MNHKESLAKASKDLMLKEPFYGLFLIALNKVWSTKVVPTACVSLRGINFELTLNPEFWEKLVPLQHMGLLKHELLHIGFFHLTDFNHLEDQDIANIAMDIEINQYIDPKWLPPNPCLPSSFPDLKLEEKKGTHYYYKKLMQRKNQSQKWMKALRDAIAAGQQTLKLPGKGGTITIPDHVWEEVKKMDEATQNLLKSQTAHIISQVADQVEKSRGTIPGEFEEILKRLNTTEPPKFDWRGYMRRFVGKSIEVYTKKSRRKFNKRMPDMPGLKIKQKKHILVAIDTSGSVSTSELKEFLHEIYHMKKAGAQVTVCQCDTAISSIKPFNPREDFAITGRGGTDFQPVIDYYNENMHKFSCLFYLTDGEAPAPEDAKGNILWVLSSKSTEHDELPGPIIMLN